MSVRVNLVINQGSTFYQEVQLFDKDGDALRVTYANGDPIYTSAAQFRKSYQASNAVSFDTALANGVMILSLTANATSNVNGGRYVYDAELTSSNTTTRIIEGIVTVRPEVTKV